MNRLDKYNMADYHSCPNCGHQDNFINPIEIEGQSHICENCDSNMQGVFREILISDIRGIYIPNDFYNNYDFSLWGLDKKEFSALSSPDNEFYWDAWNELLNEAKREYNGKTWHLDQEGDLFAIAYID